MVCGPVCVVSDKQQPGEIPPIGDWCESAFEDQSNSTEIDHPWKAVFKGNI